MDADNLEVQQHQVKNQASHHNGPAPARSWAVVQQHHQLRRGSTVKIRQCLLQSSLVPSLHHGCQL